MPKEKVREHVSAILPFQILEKIVDKPLRIRGIAVTACLSALEVATWPFSANGVVKSSLPYRA